MRKNQTESHAVEYVFDGYDDSLDSLAETDVIVPPSDPQAKAEVLRECINGGAPRSEIRALFIGFTASISEGGDGLAAEHMAELRALVAVYEEYDALYLAELLEKDNENMTKGLAE